MKDIGVGGDGGVIVMIMIRLITTMTTDLL